MSTKYRIFILIAAILLPVASLTLNNGGFFFGVGGGGIFGNFSNVWFYIIALVNGLVMLVELKEDRLSLALFYLKIVGFTYIVYFTIVFLPFMPYGVIGIVFYGLGLLIFVPATVFAAELFQILRDAKRFKTKYMKGMIAAVLLGVITIPVALSVSFNGSTPLVMGEKRI